MSHPSLRVLAHLAVALASIGIAEAGVGAMSGGAFSSLRHFAPVQTVQSGDCWYDNGWNGPGYYPCGDEWNSRPDGPTSSIIIPAFRRHHRHAAVVEHPQARNPIYSGAPSPGLRAVAPVFGGASGQHRFGAAGAPTPNFHPGAATVTPGLAGGRFHSGLGEANLHQVHGAGVPHGGGPGLAGAGRFHGADLGVPHFGAPASPGFTGGAGLHGLGGASGVHIGGPVSPGFPGVGTFHAGGGVGALHIGAPAGVHGVGAGGAFHGGGPAFGQGGIGHR